MPKARTSDPVTSHEAADSVQKVSTTQLAVYKLLKKHMTDQELHTSYVSMVAAGKAPMASESGIRSRRAELVQLSLVEPKGFARTWSGRRCIVWGRV